MDSVTRGCCLLAVAALVGAGCAGVPRLGSAPRQRVAVGPAVAALQQGDFAAATRLSGQVLGRDPDNSRAHLVAAVTRYKVAMEALNLEVRRGMEGFIRRDVTATDRLKTRLVATIGELEALDRHLAMAARDRAIELDLCMACWKVDWNGNGRLDESDERLFQIEIDAQGRRLSEGDPRRKPTFRFDLGDVHWARAMLAFQRATMELVLAYPWAELLQRLLRARDDGSRQITLAVADPTRLPRLREALLTGLQHADLCRREILAETDDEREWLPNPRQRNHPMPLRVDDGLFQTWAGVIGDLERLARSQEALPIGELAQAISKGLSRGKEPTFALPSGSLDLGRFLQQPRPLVFVMAHLENVRDDPDAVLRDLFGEAYLTTPSRPSPLIGRLARMAHEVQQGQESLARKLRYLLWLN